MTESLIDDVRFRTIIEIGEKRAKVIEELIELHLQPKPKWLPLWAYHRLIKLILKLVIKENL